MSKKKSKKKEKYWNSIIAIFTIILLFLLVGLYFERVKELKRIEDKEKKQRRLNEIEERIKNLQEQKERIENKEKKILLIARIIISLILVISNYLNYHFCLESLNLSDILDFNGAVLLIYAFIAYIFYGTIDRFVQALKLRVTHILRKNHIDSLTELELLQAEKATLINDLESIDNMNTKTLTELEKKK